jgi:hypothetical protein
MDGRRREAAAVRLRNAKHHLGALGKSQRDSRSLQGRFQVARVLFMYT